MVIRRSFLPALLVAAIMMAGTARETQASIDFTSSMTASCHNAACDMIRFVLSVPDQIVNGVSYTNAMVDIIRIYALKPIFDFGSVVSVWNADQSLFPGAWSADISANPLNSSVEIALSSGALANQPIYLLISMASATPSRLYDGSLSYFANGLAADGSVSGAGYSTGGQVTPEPITMILMGSGLLGVGGAARRRRKRLEVEQA